MNNSDRSPQMHMLNNYAAALKNLEYEVEVGALSPELPVNSLIISLDENRSLQLVVYFLGDLVAALQQVSGTSTPEESIETHKDFLQLFVRIPVEINPQSITDLARLILMVNWSTPIGAFGLNENQGLLYYRHVFEWVDADIPVAVFTEAVSGMGYFADLRFDLLASIASGEQSLSNLLSELDAAGLKQEVFPGYDR